MRCMCDAKGWCVEAQGASNSASTHAHNGHNEHIVSFQRAKKQSSVLRVMGKMFRKYMLRCSWMCAFTSRFVWKFGIRRAFRVFFFFFLLSHSLVARRLAHWLEKRSTNTRSQLTYAGDNSTVIISKRWRNSINKEAKIVESNVCAFSISFFFRWHRLAFELNIKLTAKWLNFCSRMQHRRHRRLTFVHYSGLPLLLNFPFLLKKKRKRKRRENLFAIQRRCVLASSRIASVYYYYYFASQ